MAAKIANVQEKTNLGAAAGQTRTSGGGRFSRFMQAYDDMPKSLRRGKYPFIYGLLFIPLMGYIIFYVVVNINSILLSFQEVVGVTENGFEISAWSFSQFRRAFELLSSRGTQMRTALKNTLTYFFVSVFVLLPVPFLIGYFFNKKLAGYKFFRIALFLPSIISSVAIVTMFKSIIAPNGPISDVLYKWGIEMPNLLRQENTATKTIVFFTVWTGLNSNLLLFQGAFKRIPQDVIDASSLDGANAVQELFLIMIPMMWSTLSTIIILNITGIFGASGPILLFTGGDAGTTTISYWIYQEVKLNSSYNLPSAMGLIFTLINLPIVIIFRKLFALIEDVQY